MGFLAPVVLVGKKILQDICNASDWDEAVDEEIRVRWERWRNELFLLEGINVPRCLKPQGFGKVTSAQLHSMSDASTIGYGQCSYIRLEDEHGTVHLSFLMGKARVSPKKTVSIPRLELAAAAVAVKIADSLKGELDYDSLEEYYWTDSKVVLSYINNESRRFHVYVANRVQLIQDYTSPSQWKYVNSVDNPADEGSRGMTAKDFVKKSRWIAGPDFLREHEHKWQRQEIEQRDIDADDPEVKKVRVNANTVAKKNDLLSRLERFSSWNRAKTAIAICLKYKKKLKERTKSDKQRSIERESISKNKDATVASSLLNVEDLEAAEKEIIKIMQADAFPVEIKSLKVIQANTMFKGRQLEKEKKAALKMTSTLHTLDPFVDFEGLLRVGGRIGKANFDDKLKTPVILPKTEHITKLIVAHIHKKTRHSGRGITLNELRSHGYWIINGNAVVRKFISGCVTCRHLRGLAGEQKMADLPKSRLEEAPPFTYCAVDCFGPWYVKQGRSEVKRYGVLFTCMASRAVHIEIAHSMNADSFIQALRRFISRRGTIRELRSDRGTNFIGAESELERAFDEMDDKVKTELLKEGIDWIKNPATASNFGGVWERQIRSVRNVMNALIKQHGRQLDDESLRTFVCEAEAIVNSRPLTVETLSDPLSSLPLTPNALLTGKSKLILPPPGKFQNEDVYCRRRWRRVQHISNEFWTRWKKEYLQNLQARPKWTKLRRNFEVGDVVIPTDSNSARNQWPLAKVINTIRDDQGLVRSVTIQTSNGSKLDRPINKLVLLVESQEEPQEKTG